ncbi:invasion associated locus B family protein [Paracoccus ravus]|uniref:invasion associated locus B family protein n=1 Tax=Paracoccus ravus TaxID=2447760 RepID=UPI00106DE7B0|nr:invasion associated locus B family protein [Paracoccus ravus]
MANRTSSALIAAIFAIAGSTAGVMAQETPAPAAEAPAAAAPAAPAASPAEANPAAQAPAAPAGEAAAPSAGEAQAGQPYTKETHGDWTLRCMKTAEGKDPCELYQLLKDQNGASVAETSILPMTGDVAAVITFVSPLETDLQAGLGFQVDSGKANRYPFMLCAPVGCISRVGMTEADLAPMKRGKEATVALVPFGAPKEQAVRLKLSLSGFTAGMNALAEANKGLAAPVAQEVPAPKP